MSNTSIDKQTPTSLSVDNTSFINLAASTVDNTNSTSAPYNDLTIKEEQQTMDIHSSTTEPTASLINDLLAASAFVDEPPATSTGETTHAEEVAETTASEQVSPTPPAQDTT